MLAVLLLPGCGATRPARNSLHYIVQFLDCRRRCKKFFLLESDTLFLPVVFRIRWIRKYLISWIPIQIFIILVSKI